MKRSDRCEGQYCPTVVAWDNIVLVPWDHLAKAICVTQSGCRHIMWSTTLVATWRNLVNVACCNVTQKFFDQRICCDGCCRQTNFITGTMTIHCNGKGLRFNMIDLIVSTLAPSQSLKVVAQSPSVVKGSLMPCTAYAALMRLIVAWHNVHGHSFLRWNACCHFAWGTRPNALVLRGLLSYSASCHPW